MAITAYWDIVGRLRGDAAFHDFQKVAGYNKQLCGLVRIVHDSGSMA